ncbi:MULTISPECIES: glycosyltransferase family 2 protein [Halomonadaceae]|uniref:glycosyltransferase family 2 protein n=1 Tax=Halomonadaceae TaxID=28256 RepID=UPI0015816FFC|nr:MULTISPECIES: glycosyltransferase [Halomonas]MDI4635980.1 glycosyltransferase [Halomonas sp. BMC7]NUJ60345.1 glycosyltransferase family 2 protein [Halomonas taeanensis]
MNSSPLPLVSFYMSVKNGFPFLQGSIESIKNQTYPNWEAVIVDDGSTDGSFSYLRDVEKKDSRFKVLSSQGGGRGKSLNMAIMHAQGEYVANLDADDLSHPQRLDVQVGILLAQGIGFLYSETNYIHDDDVVEWKPIPRPYCQKVDDESRELMKRNPVSHISVICLRKNILQVGGYSEERKSQLDYELWFRLVKEGGRLQKTSYSLAAKRIHTGQSFENKKRISYLLSTALLQNRIISEMKGGWRYRLFPFLRFFYGLLPQKIRVRRVL